MTEEAVAAPAPAEAAPAPANAVLPPAVKVERAELAQAAPALPPGETKAVRRGPPTVGKVAPGENSKMKGTPLFDAVCFQDVDKIRALAADGIDLEEFDTHGLRAIHKAASRGLVDVVKVLIELGAKKNPIHLGGETPLMRAASNGHAGVVELLLKEGVFVDFKNALKMTRTTLNAKSAVRSPGTDATQLGNSARDLAHKKGHSEVVLLLDQHVYSETPKKGKANKLALQDSKLSANSSAPASPRGMGPG